MQRRLRSISAKAVSVTLNYLTYFSIILASTMGPLYTSYITEIGENIRFSLFSKKIQTNRFE